MTFCALHVLESRRIVEYEVVLCGELVTAPLHHLPPHLQMNPEELAFLSPGSKASRLYVKFDIT